MGIIKACAFLLFCFFAFLLFFLSFFSKAIIVNEHAFEQLGGNLNHTEETASNVFEKLKKKSLNPPYYTAVSIYDDNNDKVLSAVWIGNDGAGFSYFLTAAHAFNQPMVEATAVHNISVYSWRNALVAQGDGTLYVPPERYDASLNRSLAESDIAILKLPAKRKITDEGHHFVDKPIVNDQQNENGHVSFVGYGQWGVGNRRGLALVHPDSGGRMVMRGRAYGESVLTQIQNYLLIAGYEPFAETNRWGK